MIPEMLMRSNENMKRNESVLFLCTGNYYRSRLAEEIFNHWAKQQENKHVAISRALAPNVKTLGNIGPIASYALKGLSLLNIIPTQPNRWPISVQSEDFKISKLTICMCYDEHKPLVEKYFPEMMKMVFFWDILDIKYCSYEEATLSIQKKVLELLIAL